MKPSVYVTRSLIYNQATSSPLYPGRPIFTNFLTSTLTFAGAGWAGASLASLAALRALERRKKQVVHRNVFDTYLQLKIWLSFTDSLSYIGWLCKIKRKKVSVQWYIKTITKGKTTYKLTGWSDVSFLVCAPSSCPVKENLTYSNVCIITKKSCQ